MKKLNVLLNLPILAAALAASSLSAIQIDQAKIHLINQSSKPSFENEDVEEDKIIHELQQREMNVQIPENEQPLLDEGQEDEEVVNDFSAKMAEYYSTTHLGAYHKAVSVSADGQTFEIEDKSVWQVHGWDADKLKTWNQMHTIVLAPNTNIITRWFYPYKFINLDTHQIVKCKMILTPVLNDPQVDIYTHWIEEIDYNSKLLRLEDGSLWSINSSDSDVMRSFAKYNIVIVGTNDGWFRSSCPNILLCIRNNKYIRGIVIN